MPKKKPKLIVLSRHIAALKADVAPWENHVAETRTLIVDLSARAGDFIVDQSQESVEHRQTRPAQN